jgi:hypothetical protein
MLTLNSKKKKVVIVADPHNDIQKLDSIIKREDADINICLGDWYDSFVYDSPLDYEATTKYLRDTFLPDPRNYTLFGNHDIHYLYYNESAMCSGYEEWKYRTIDDALGKDRGSVRNKFHWFIVLDDILLTHAGLDNRLLPPHLKTNTDIFNYLDSQTQQVSSKLISNDVHWFYQVGHSRGGRFKAGGIVWCDFDYEFSPIDDLRQIVGHTSQWETGRAKQHITEGVMNIADANNICIDCHLNQYLVLTNGKLELKNYTDL